MRLFFYARKEHIFVIGDDLMPSFSKYKTKQGWRWMFKLELGTDPKTGKRRNTTRRGFLHKPDAEEICRGLQSKLRNGESIVENNVIVKDYMKAFLNYYASTGKVKQQTVNLRKTQAKHLNNQFGFLKVRLITHAMYQQFIFDLKNINHLSKSSISGIHALGSMFFKRAKKDGIISKSPADDTDLPAFEVSIEEIETISEKYLEKDEINLFLDKVKEEKYKDMPNFFFTLIWTGMRIGELIALTWDDVDLDNSEINIRKTFVSSLRSTSSPKTKSSVRKISIEPEVIQMFKKQHALISEVELQDGHFNIHNLIFPKLIHFDRGSYYDQSLIERIMKRVMKKTGIKKTLTPHSLRHTHVSLMAEAGVSLEDIMVRVGHHNDAITKQIYMHVTKSRRKNTSYKFGELMRKKG
jgi:integrase